MRIDCNIAYIENLLQTLFKYIGFGFFPTRWFQRAISKTNYKRTQNVARSRPNGHTECRSWSRFTAFFAIFFTRQNSILGISAGERERERHDIVFETS
jgi:hypothetical protein